MCGSWYPTGSSLRSRRTQPQSRSLRASRNLLPARKSSASMASSCPACPMLTVMPSNAPWPETRNIESVRAIVSGPGAKRCMRLRIESGRKTCGSSQLNCSSKCSSRATPDARSLDVNPLWEAVSHAARAAGIGLTFLPTLYQSSDFGGQPLKPEQARFFLDTDEFLSAIERRIADERRANNHASNPMLRTGAAFHSLRAVPLDHLRRAALALRGIDASMPVHIHVAEQMLEVRACETATGRRPIELLLDQDLLTPHWCVVHATHATPGELEGLVAAGAAVCVSVSTEANLGDGFFDAARFLNMDGRRCVGSDSQSTVSPAEELRWLEYQQRLRKRRRGVLAAKSESHVGTRLWRDAALSGARALGQAVGRIAVGCRADWLVLDAEHPSMAGASADTALDRLLFAGADKAIRDVMVGGQWVVKGGSHSLDGPLRADFGRVMNHLRTG